MASDYYGPFYQCEGCSGDERGDCHRPQDVALYRGKPICELCYDRLDQVDGDLRWDELPSVVTPELQAARADAAALREAATDALRLLQRREVGFASRAADVLGAALREGAAESRDKLNYADSVAVRCVLEERKRQDAGWGEQNHDPFLYLTILGEEYGEACQAALHERFGGRCAGGLREELAQVAATAIAAIECLDRAKWVWGGHAASSRLDGEKDKPAGGAEHRDRLEAMLEDDKYEWDLYDNDKAAIRWALDALAVPERKREGGRDA